MHSAGKPGRPQRILSYASLAAVTGFVLLPVYNLVMLAVDDSMRTGRILDFRFLPRDFGWEGFAIALRAPAQNQDFSVFLGNSLVASGSTALIAIALGASMAYAFARMRFPGRRLGLFALLLGALLPPVAIMVPMYLLLSTLGIRTSLLGLLIAYAAFALPLGIWNMRSAFQAVPRELEEAAFIDGAGPLVTFVRVSLPIAAPAILVAALIAFLMAYTEFALGWVLLNDPEHMTLAMALRNMSGFSGTAWNILAAFTILMSAPVVAIFLVLQRYLLGGLVPSGLD